MKNIIFNGLFVSVLLLSLGSCTKDFEEINTNPNAPTEAPASNVLAFAIQDHAANVYDSWGLMDEPATYSGQIAKTAYVDESRYQFRDGTVENNWTYVSRELKNLELVKMQAREQGNANMEAASTIFQTFIWQYATDRWRDLPFTTALQGDEGVILQEYSTQEEIYPELLNRLKTAADLLNQGSIDELGSGDILFSGDLDKWKKFANSLRLRVAIRISGIAPDLARANIEEIAGNPTQYPVMESNDDNAFVWWPGTQPYYEPWADALLARVDYGSSATMINTLKDLADPRLAVYAKPAISDGQYRGAVVGLADANTPNPNTISNIGARFADDRAGFTPFMRASEVQFILAEAALNGWNVGVSAQEAYEAGVRLSLEENEISASAISAYLAGNGKWDNSKTTLYLQKWISLFKNGHEAWAETRRTDIPLMSAAPGSPYPGHNRPPFRYPYPTSETTLNGANSAPFVAEVEDYFWGKKMWWDTRANVN